MNNPAFIVDGQMETKIVNFFCPEKPVRLLNCNGRDVKLNAAAKRMASLIRLLKRNNPIIIIFDRETRDKSSDDIAKELLEEIQKQGIQNVEILIGVPDIMTENWMLASIEGLNAHYKIECRQENFEGKNGKSQLKKIIRPKTYSETVDGPEIIKHCKIENICKNSSSFKQFYDKIEHLNCKKIRMPN